MSVFSGPSEGTWSVFAMKVVEERDRAREDYASLEADAGRVVLAYLRGDRAELDQAVSKLMSNGRHEWWKKYKPVGLRGDDDDDCG